MKTAIKAVLREFYDDGIPADAIPRDVDYCEKLRAATVVKGMRRTGKTFVTYLRMRTLMEEGVKLGRIVHLNFRALKNAMAETGIKDGTIVTWDDERKIDGIRIAPIWKWCIENSSCK